MGICKIIQNTYATHDYLLNSINYICRNAIFYDGVYVSPEDSCNQMMYVKNYFHKTSGNQLMHIIVVFESGVDDRRAIKYSYDIAKYYGDRFQTMFAVHQKYMSYKGAVKSCYHTHFILNSVSYIDGKMFAESKGDIYKFVEYIKKCTRDKKIRILYGTNQNGIYEDEF